MNDNQECLEKSRGTKYHDLRSDQCQLCKNLENTHKAHVLCPG